MIKNYQWSLCNQLLSAIQHNTHHALWEPKAQQRWGLYTAWSGLSWEHSYLQVLLLSYIELQGDCGRDCPPGCEIRNIVRGPDRSKKENRRPLKCIRSPQWISSGGWEGDGGKSRGDMDKRGNWSLKIQMDFWPRSWELLYIGTVLPRTNGERNPHWAYVCKQSGRTPVLFFVGESYILEKKGDSVLPLCLQISAIMMS